MQRQKKKLVIMTGAGISAESGVPTFRDSNGLWEGHNVMDVATPEGWHKNQELVLDFYNKRRAQLKNVEPNAGHLGLADLEQFFDVCILTQNVDDLHERAGSTNVVHLHGELLKVRSVRNTNYILPWNGDLSTGDVDPQGHQLRPHIVWFGEELPALEDAVRISTEADIFAVIGTSLQVYPAAGLVDLTGNAVPVFYIDPNPAEIRNLNHRLTVISESATVGVGILKNYC